MFYISRVPGNGVSSSQYVRQEMRNKIAAKAQQQGASPQHPNFQQSVGVGGGGGGAQQQQQQSPLSSQLGELMSAPISSQHTAAGAGNMGPPPSYSPAGVGGGGGGGFTSMTQQQQSQQQQGQMTPGAVSSDPIDSVLPDDILDQSMCHTTVVQ